MTPAARVQAAIELVDEILGAAREGGAAADTLIARYFKARRYAGSKDRRAVRELVFRAVRRAGECPQSGRSAMLGLAESDPILLELFDGSAHAAAPPAAGEQVAAAGIAPAWLLAGLDPLIGEDELQELLDRAPLDLRANRLKGSREQALAAFDGAAPTPHSPLGLRLPDPVQVETFDAWRSGLVEVQDEGSQLLCLGCEAAPGMTVVDLCAGAGGKTLALAAEMENRGRILASDTNRGRLSRMTPRLERAGVTIAEPLLLDPSREAVALGGTEADLVLVDAPCSGSGTWRRNPETRWRLTPARLEALLKLQSYLLDVAMELVRPGGHLVYAVCSLLTVEGRGQAEMLTRRSSLVPVEPVMPAGRAAGSGMLLSPGRDGTDGFFIARWRRPC